ncbi:MAG: outer membrane channel protein TolC [Vibrio sp.]
MKKLIPLMVSMALAGVSQLTFADDLAQVYNEAKQNDPQLLRSQAERDAAFDNVKATRGVLLPQINLTAGYNVTRSNKDSVESDDFTGGISLSQILFDRASWVNLDTAEKQARQADSVYAAQQQSTILNVSSAYFEVLRAKDNLAFVRAEKAAVGRQLEQTKQRFDVGLSAITDVHDAQAEYDSVLADEILAQNELTNSYEALREITGTMHDNLKVLDTARFSTSLPSKTPESLVEAAQKTNLELLSARISQDIAKDNISLASSGHLPTLSFDAGYDYVDSDNPNGSTYDTDYNSYNAGVNLSMPIFTGGTTSAQVDQAENNYVAASETLEETYRGVVRNVHAYYNNINASIGAIKAYQQAVVSAQSSLDASEAGFEVGTRTIVDVLDATRRLYDANRNLANSRYDYIISVLQLKQALGTLSEQDILDINQGLKIAS